MECKSLCVSSSIDLEVMGRGHLLPVYNVMYDVRVAGNYLAYSIL